MQIGVFYFPVDYGIDIAELARALEVRGFESLFVPEHTHIPTSRRSPWPGGPDLPAEYRETLDPFLALTAAAVATERLLLGTGICLVVERDPITTAKEVATLDFLSGGRFLFGIGGGWNREEMEHHGTDPARRFAVMRERVLAMQEIWTHDVAEFHGEFVNFDPSWCWPKPAKKPHPPILLGGEGPNTLQRVVDLCNGWFPRGRNPELVLTALGDLKQRAAKAGRDMKTISVSAFAAPADRAVLDRFAAAGVTRSILRLPSEGRDKILPLLDQYAKLL